jgi:outer membrane protein assembly factor BamB
MAGDDVLWEHDAHQRTDGCVLSPSLVIVRERWTKLVRLDPEDGRVLWTADVRKPWGQPAADASVSVYLNQHSYLQAFDTATGEPRWETDLAGPHGSIFRRPLVVGDAVVIGGSLTDVVALSAQDGRTLWTFDGGGRDPGVPLAGPGRTILVPNPRAERAWLLDAGSGQRLADLPCPARLVAGERSGVAWTGRSFVGVDPSGRIFAVSPDGELTEVLRPRSGVASAPPAVLGDLMLFENERCELVAHSLHTGQEVWRDAIHHRRAELWAVSLPAGRLVVGTAFGQLRFYDVDGTPVGKYTVGQHVNGPLSTTSEGDVLVAVDGRVAAVRAEGGARTHLRSAEVG